MLQAQEKNKKHSIQLGAQSELALLEYYLGFCSDPTQLLGGLERNVPCVIVQPAQDKRADYARPRLLCRHCSLLESLFVGYMVAVC